MGSPLISIVIPTKNSSKTLTECLESIKNQNYGNCEIIIVDGNSTDDTQKIAKRYADQYLSFSGTVPASRNLGFSKAKGTIFFSVDSDMILQQNVLNEIRVKSLKYGSLIIPEKGFGKNFLSRCKDLEKRCYIGSNLIESARVFSKDVFNLVGGYNEYLILGEDWELSERIRKKTSIGRIDAFILHNTSHLSLKEDLKKSFHYGHSFDRYAKSKSGALRDWSSTRSLLLIQLSHKIFSEPLTTIGLLSLKIAEYSFGILGLLTNRIGL